MLEVFDNVFRKTPSQISEQYIDKGLDILPIIDEVNGFFDDAFEGEYINPVDEVDNALSSSGTKLDNVNNDNVMEMTNKVVTNPTFQAKMKKLEPSLGSKFISDIPKYLILGVVITILVFVLKGKVSPAAGTAAAAQQLSGCYMIYGDGKDYNYVKLDGCSDWYSESTDNLLKCRCNNADSDISKPSDCTGDNSDSPYCIGKIDTS